MKMVARWWYYAQNFQIINDNVFMLDEFSYFGISKADAEKRKAMWKKSGLNARCAKKANEKYVVYREYHGDMNEIDDSALLLCLKISSMLSREAIAPRLRET
jgi:hypothetical protein